MYVELYVCYVEVPLTRTQAANIKAPVCDETNPTIPGQRSLPFLSQGSRHHPPTSLARMLFPIRSWPTSHIHLPGAVRIQKISKPLLFIIFSRKSLDPRVPFLFFPWACSCGYRLVPRFAFLFWFGGTGS